MSVPKYLEKEEFRTLIRIGFCQPKFYTRSTWAKAKRIMDDLVCPNGLAYPFNFGRGKGKYDSNLEINQVEEKAWEIYKKANI